MGKMISVTHFDVFAVAARSSEFSFDGGADQVWTDLLAAAISGIVLLPFALFVMWVFHKSRLDRWFVATSFPATITSAIVVDIINAQLWEIYAFVEHVLHMIGVHRWVYMGFPNLLTCLFGAMGFGWWLKHRPARNRPETVG